jgi:acyl-ACP thioesterase
MEKINDMKYITQIKLFPSYFDLNDRIKPTAVMSIFQDVASEHGERLGIGFKAMLDKKLYWIIIRAKYDVLTSPVPYQDVVVETWPHQKGKVDFDRDYLIKDTDGNVLIKGTSKWCVISSETRKLELPDGVDYNTSSPFCPEINYTERFVKTPSIERRATADYEHRVGYNEIDHNMHLNNVNYATYVFETLEAKDLKHLQINFISECKLGETIEVFKQVQDDGSFLISGYEGDELKFSALAN